MTRHARHITLTIPLSIQDYKWVVSNCLGELSKFWGIACKRIASHPEGVGILPSHAIIQNNGTSSGCVGPGAGVLIVPF